MSDDLHSLSGAYVLDALTDDERADFEVHLERCPTCRDEVASLREVAPLLAETVAVDPPPSLRADILARAAETRQDPPVVSTEDSPGGAGASGDSDPERTDTSGAGSVTPLRRRRRWVALAAAAALVVGGGITWQVVDRSSTSVTEEVADADDARTWQTETADGGTVEVIHSESVGRTVLRVEGLADPGEGKAYQAWLQDDEGHMSPAGVMADTDGEMLLEGDLDDAEGVGVSTEPAEGSKQPTSNPVALIELG